MKKMMMAAVAFVFTAGVSMAQDSQGNKSEPAKQVDVQAVPTAASSVKAEPAKCDNKNCCMMKGGKMVGMKDGKEMPMSGEMKLSDGSTITPDGTLISKDGKKRRLKNNECVDMHGKSCVMPEENHELHSH